MRGCAILHLGQQVGDAVNLLVHEVTLDVGGDGLFDVEHQDDPADVLIRTAEYLD